MNIESMLKYFTLKRQNKKYKKQTQKKAKIKTKQKIKVITKGSESAFSSALTLRNYV